MNLCLGQASAPPATRIYAIGDVHGYLSLLKKMLASVLLDLEKTPIENYRIVLLGDYIDRGPDSAGCIDYLIDLISQDKNVTCLKGNHEHKLERFLSDPLAVAESFFTYGGVETAESYGVEMQGYRHSRKDALQKADELESRMPKEHRRFYASLAKTITLGDYLFTHGGVRPGVALDQQKDRDLMGIRSEFLSHTGLFDKVIVHGHTPAYPMEVLPNRINVDTHAYRTGVLSCVVLQGTEYRVIEAR